MGVKDLFMIFFLTNGKKKDHLMLYANFICDVEYIEISNIPTHQGYFITIELQYNLAVHGLMNYKTHTTKSRAYFVG